VENGNYLWGEEARHLMQYAPGFKANVVRRLTGPSAVTATALAKELGLSQPTLSRWVSRWVREASSLRRMSDEKKQVKAKSPAQWTAAEKLRVIGAAAALSDEELGEFLRREGIHKAQLDEWRAAAAAGLEKPRKESKASPEAKRVKQLEKELRRKEKALAEAAALLVLKKKAQEIWGDEDDSTGEKSGK
jgi:transposase